MDTCARSAWLGGKALISLNVFIRAPRLGTSLRLGLARPMVARHSMRAPQLAHKLGRLDNWTARLQTTLQV